LVKEAIPVGVNISGTVVVLRNQATTVVDGNIRTALGRLMGSLTLGQPLRQSDVIQAIETVPGVSYAVVPLTKLARQDGAMTVREELQTSQTADWLALSTSPLHPWHNDTVTIYLVQDTLFTATANGGGEYNNFRGVFFDDVPLTLFPGVPLYTGTPLKGISNGACIIGNAGMSIPGYSDDATILAGYPMPTDSAARAAEVLRIRALLTANRVLLSLATGVTPSNGTVTVTYFAAGDSGAKNIEPGPTEYLVLGDLDFTYDEDRDFTSLVTGRRV
jgi:hypothetical protein